MKDDHESLQPQAQDRALHTRESVRPRQKVVLRVALATLMSLIIPGLGQFLNRQPLKAILFFLLTFFLWFFFLGWIFHLLAALDAGLVSFRQNTTNEFDPDSRARKISHDHVDSPA